MTLTESLISLVLTIVVTSTALALATPATRGSLVQPEAMDVQQRARVAAETIARDLAAAGVGIAAGPQSGLELALPAILPRQLGVTGDSADIARADSITIITVPSSGAQTTTAAAMSPASLTLTVNASPNCVGAVLCGLSAGRDVLLANEGHFDIFRITNVTGAVASLRHHGQSLGHTYPAGSTVAEVATRTYSLDGATRILRQYDGDLSDQPAADHIASLTFDYFGDDIAGPALVPIDRASLADGPWLGAGSSRYDADLLRVRMIRVSVRAEAASASLRANAPDVTVRVDVAPRSLVLR